MNQVEWKVKGLFKADAVKVFDEISSLGDSYTAEDIVEYARDENSELHKCFTWDNDIAAEKYRKYEAQTIVTQLVVKTVTTDNEPVSVRVISRSENAGRYAPTEILVKSEVSYADLLQRALAELQAFKAKYATRVELREMFDAIEALV